MSAAPFYDDGEVTIWCADLRTVPASELAEVAACVVTSPPYNVGLAYDGDDQGDTLPWDAYWRLADAAAQVMARALLAGGRAWVNTAVSVPEIPGHTRAGLANGGCWWLGDGRMIWSSVRAWSWSTRCRGPRCALGLRVGYVAVVEGMRWGEVAGLRVGHVDFVARTLVVRKTIVRGRRGAIGTGEPKSAAGGARGRRRRRSWACSKRTWRLRASTCQTSTHCSSRPPLEVSCATPTGCAVAGIRRRWLRASAG